MHNGFESASGPPGAVGASGDGLPVFRLRDLPAEVEVSARAHAMTCLAEHAAGGLERAVHGVPDPEALVTCLQWRDIVSSIRMAGHTVSPIETWSVALLVVHHRAGAGDEFDGSVRDNPVARFVLAARQLAAAAGREPVDIDLLGAVSATLTGVRPRSARDGLRRVDSVVTTGPDGPPYARTTPPDELAAALGAWDRWVAAPYEGPRLIRIAVAHAALELVQPYPEANGHVARLFSTAEMVRQGVVDSPVLSLSRWLDDNLHAYHRQLAVVAATGQWSAWVEFYARAVREQARAHTALIGSQALLRAELAGLTDGSPSLRKVVAALPTSPVTSIQALCDLHGISQKTAARSTRDLVARGVLRVLAEHPFRIFVCDRAMDVLALQPVSLPRGDAEAFGG